MKAKEYFEKYNEAIYKEAQENSVTQDGPMAQMFIAFASEMKQIIKQRRVATDKGALSVINEQNQKWNAVTNLFIQKYGVSPIQRNGFYLGMKTQLEGVATQKAEEEA